MSPLPAQDGHAIPQPARAAGVAEQERSMAELNVQRTDATRNEVVEDDYENWEIALWLLGILAIPGVPIVMVVLLTPWTGL